MINIKCEKQVTNKRIYEAPALEQRTQWQPFVQVISVAIGPGQLSTDIDLSVNFPELIIEN